MCYTAFEVREDNGYYKAKVNTESEKENIVVCSMYPLFDWMRR